MHYIPDYSVEVPEDGGEKAYTVAYEGQILVSEPSLSLAVATQIAVDENLRAVESGHLPLAEVVLWPDPVRQVFLFIPGRGYLCTGGQWKFDGIFVQMPERIAQRFCAEGRLRGQQVQIRQPGSCRERFCPELNRVYPRPL